MYLISHLIVECSQGALISVTCWVCTNSIRETTVPASGMWGYNATTSTFYRPYRLPESLVPSTGSGDHGQLYERDLSGA